MVTCLKSMAPLEKSWTYGIVPKCWQLWPLPLTFWPQKVKVSSSHHPASLYEIWKLYVENYSNYLVRTKMLAKFHCDLDLWIPKCIGIFLSPSCIHVWNMKAVCWKLLKLSCQNQSVDKVPLWPWPLDPKMYRYLPLAIPHPCMKYESCTLKTTQIIVSESKCWQSSVLTLTFALLTPNCIGIFFSPSCIYVWNVKAAHWNLLMLLCQNHSVDNVPFWFWPLDPKMYRYLPLAILHLCMKYEAVRWKLLKLLFQNQSVDKVPLWPWS